VTDLTTVELLFLKDRIERWIRFGRAAEERILDRRRKLVSFAPGSVFAFVRWAANEHGTIVSRIDILRACGPHEARSTVPGVQPGAESLLRLSGWPKVERALQAIDAVEALDVPPEDASPDHWRHVHNRITARDEPRPYTREQHRAWLLRRRIDG